MSLSPLAEMLSRRRLLIFDFDGTLSLLRKWYAR